MTTINVQTSPTRTIESPNIRIQQRPRRQVAEFQVLPKMDYIDIHSRGQYPANVLSNFSRTDFTFDGVRIKSIEGFLQGLKFKDPETQKRFCLMDGFTAKKMSKSIKRAKEDMLLQWNGQIFRRDSEEYKSLLKRVVKAQEKSPKSAFMFDGKEVSSVNAFLLSLKVHDPEKQSKVCALPLDEVKETAKTIQEIFDDRTLYWKGKAIGRTTPEYQKLLKSVYSARFKQDSRYRTAIRASKGRFITHSIGKDDVKQTILTKNEFINLIKRLQNKDNFYFKLKDFILKRL